MTRRRIILGDAFEVLPQLVPHDTIVASLPDAADMAWEIERWEPWFLQAARLCLDATPPHGLTVFYQTDRKADGRWHSKASLLLSLGRRLLWHKVVLRRPPGRPDFYRPSYAHLLAFSELGKVGRPWADVIPPSRALTGNGMPLGAIDLLLPYAHGFGPRICDPFCGVAPLLALAEELDAFEGITGIEIDPAAAASARTLRIERD